MDWKNLAIFMAITLPSVFVLTHVIAWYAKHFKEPSFRRRKVIPWYKRKELPKTPTPTVLPYKTYEEYKEDLVAGVPIDDFIERCHEGRPESPVLTAKRKLEAIQKGMEKEAVQESFRHRFDPAVGHWYRKGKGALVLLAGTTGCAQGFGKFMVDAHNTDQIPFSEVAPAYPREGEWWTKKRCESTHGIEHADGKWLEGEAIQWKYTTGEYTAPMMGNPRSGWDALFAAERAACECGCLMPVNFGEGLKGSHETKSHWAEVPPEKRCENCKGHGIVAPAGIALDDHIASACRCCGGSGLKYDRLF